MAKTAESAGCLAFHGADRISEDLRGLRFGQLLPVPQYDHGPLPFWEPAQGLDQAVPVDDQVIE